MGGRYDILAREEFEAHRVRFEVRRQISRFLESPGAPSERQHVNILDWGCGRGASVATLLDQGFNVYGVEIDREVMEKGYPLFRERGRDPCEFMMPVEETGRFPDGFFHFIFSEEVLEHVEDISDVALEMSRLTRPGGTGVHLFPGSRKVVEPHLFMPFVHWLPKCLWREKVIVAFQLLKVGPKWPGVDELGVRKAAEIYRSYLDEHTHYRDIRLILETFQAAGFKTGYETSGTRANRWAPGFLRTNGFPGGGITLITSRPSTEEGPPEKGR